MGPLRLYLVFFTLVVKRRHHYHSREKKSRQKTILFFLWFLKRHSHYKSKDCQFSKRTHIQPTTPTQDNSRKVGYDIVSTKKILNLNLFFVELQRGFIETLGMWSYLVGRFVAIAGVQSQKSRKNFSFFNFAPIFDATPYVGTRYWRSHFLMKMIFMMFEMKRIHLKNQIQRIG